MPAKRTTNRKPRKPHADFPLLPHANGLWAKKVCGKLHYFGPWEDPDAALEKWLAQKWGDAKCVRESYQESRASLLEILGFAPSVNCLEDTPFW